MSRARQRRREQGHVEGGSHGVYGIRGYEESLFAYFGQDEGLCPRLHGFRVWIQPDDHNDDFSYLLVDEDCMFEFLRYICPRLKERRDLQDEKEKWLREKRDLRDEKEELQATLQASESSGIARGLSVELLRREVAEATAEIKRLTAINAELQKDISEAKQDINKAHQDANEAIEEASSTKQRLEETESAFAEEKQKYISAPDLVPCLQSLADEVKTLQRDVRTTTELMAKKPEGNRRSEKTLQQMKRVLHDVGRYPRRRRREKTADAADDGGGAMRRGRICYSCRCKGHLAQDCPRVRTTDMVESSNPTTSDSQQRAGEPNTEASSSSGWTIFSALRRFTSGID